MPTTIKHYILLKCPTAWNAYNNIVLYLIKMPTAWNAYNNIVLYLIKMPLGMPTTT